MLRVNTAERIKVLLRDSLGTLVTGLVAADFSASSVYVYKSDGSKTTVALTLGINLFEADAVDAPGLYEVILSATETDTLGILTVSIQPAAALFVSTYVTEVVEDLSTLIGTPVVSVSTDIASVYSRIGAPVGASISADITSIKADTTTTVAVLPLTTIASANNITTAEANIETSIKGPDNRDLTQMAGAGFVSANDSLIALKSTIIGISGATAAAVLDELLNIHILPGSFGEFMNILSAIMLNRVKIDKLTKTLTVYQADNVTPLKTYPLYDLNGNPALLNASERGKGV